jgi:hypothetical protein
MPRVNSRWRADPNRARYYRLRSEKLERELSEAKQNLIPAKKINADLRRICGIIQEKIQRSELESGLRKELNEDISDFLNKVSLNGKNGKSQNCKARLSRRGAKLI